MSRTPGAASGVDLEVDHRFVDAGLLHREAQVLFVRRLDFLR